MLSEAERQRRRQLIVKLRKQGCSVQEIATNANLGTATVATTITDLIRQGVIEVTHRGHPFHAFWRDLDHPKTKGVIAMVKAHATLQEIGKFLGNKTREYARQTVANIEALYGSGILEPQEKWYSIREAAKMCNVSLAHFRNICKQEGILFHRRGKHQRLIDQKTLEMLRWHPRITGKKSYASSANS